MGIAHLPAGDALGRSLLVGRGPLPWAALAGSIFA